jgi:pimeloyl-ACP methyl ester carboxylesterase
MRRLAFVLIALLLAAIVLPPLWFTVFPETPPELPPADRRIDVGGASLSAVVRGQGRPVVLVHGLPGSGHDWRPLTDVLVRRGHHVIAYDRLGYGRSDPRPDDDFTEEGNARDLIALLESEGIEDATVVGWSYGGGTAIRAAIQDPSRIGRLVLVASSGPWPDAPEDPAVFGLLFSRPVMGWVRAVPPLGRALRATFSEEAFAPEPVADWWGDQLAANFAQPHTQATWLAEGARFEWDEDLDPSSIRLPILVIQGDADRSVPLEVARILDERAPRSQLVVIEGAGHMLPITRPDVLAQRIAAFTLIR